MVQSSSPIDVRRLGPEDSELWATLRREALENHPMAFGASVPEDATTLVMSFRSRASNEDSAVFGAFSNDSLVGIVGVYRNPGAKERHKATIWGMYVTAGVRQRGVGERLVRTAVAHARAWHGVQFVHLAVSDAADTARRLYERVGFREWGREPRALRWEGRYTDEAHMILNLDTTGADQ
jgi:RimJ/RimL family protein N-acetyltransferase